MSPSVFPHHVLLKGFGDSKRLGESSDTALDRGRSANPFIVDTFDLMDFGILRLAAYCLVHLSKIRFLFSPTTGTGSKTSGMARMNW